MAEKWVLEDDCLAPRAQIKIEFEGKNPIELYKKTSDILKKVWEVGGTDLWERDVRWDMMSGDFYRRIYINKGLDSHSKIFAEIIMEGQQPKDPTKNGKITIYISAKLLSEFELKSALQKNPLYKGLLWLYNRIFYKDVRAGYLKICQDLLNKVDMEFRSILSIPTT